MRVVQAGRELPHRLAAAAAPPAWFANLGKPPPSTVDQGCCAASLQVGVDVRLTDQARPKQARPDQTRPGHSTSCRAPPYCRRRRCCCSVKGHSKHGGGESQRTGWCAAAATGKRSASQPASQLVNCRAAPHHTRAPKTGIRTPTLAHHPHVKLERYSKHERRWSSMAPALTSHSKELRSEELTCGWVRSGPAGCQTPGGGARTRARGLRGSEGWGQF